MLLGRNFLNRTSLPSGPLFFSGWEVSGRRKRRPLLYARFSPHEYLLCALVTALGPCGSGTFGPPKSTQKPAQGPAPTYPGCRGKHDDPGSLCSPPTLSSAGARCKKGGPCKSSCNPPLCTRGLCVSHFTVYLRSLKRHPLAAPPVLPFFSSFYFLLFLSFFADNGCGCCCGCLL